MSDSTNSRPKGQGYNSDARSSPSPQISSSLESLLENGSSRPLQVTPLASRAPSISRHPPQAKAVRANLNRCGSKLSEKDLVDLRVAGLFPPADANPGAMEALIVSYSVPDHVPPSPPAAPVVATKQSPMRRVFPFPFFFIILPPLVHKLMNFSYDRPPSLEPVVVGSSSEEDEALSPLLRRYLRFSGLTSFVELLVACILTGLLAIGLAPCW
ncbi:hypothetical protein LIER_13767 [Lithospermum erythrorhizon]|uniref:Uncharacterized protein n=1 Tax=Lithospermum erythrorhizon TaxID=34254 RepID=A0AAV3PZ50_LITER